MASPTASYTAAALLASPVRRALVDALSERAKTRTDPAGLTAADLSEVVDLHVTTVRFHLDQLVAADVLAARFERQNGAGRPRKIYEISELPDPEPTSDPLRLLAGLLANAMTSAAQGWAMTAEEAGKRWARENLPSHPERESAQTAGTWIARVGEMVDVLSRWGYHPDMSTSDGGRVAEVQLHDCPFFDLARTNQDVVCGVHHGLIVQSMKQFGEDSADVSVQPFVTANRCVARLKTPTDFST
ncbi:MAG: helix-turn-helix transcriptional regulator [Nostocoides sp.]